MKLPLEKEKRIQAGNVAWTSSLPFVENSRAVLIHRPRYITVHNGLKPRCKSHLAVNMHCGNGQTGTKKFTFLEVPPQGRIVCAKCEALAVARGLPSSEQLAGRHVCTGGVIAVSQCCNGENK